VAHAISKRLPIEIEKGIGHSISKQLNSDERLVRTPELELKLQALVAPLLEVIPKNRYDYQFFIFNDPSLNAFAAPGGYIVIHSGLILEAGRPEEILGVLAHEVAHITQQHGIRNIVAAAGLFVIVQTLIGDSSALAAVLADGGAFLLQQKFSRTFEEEADDVGLQYLQQGGIDPNGLIDFFHRIQAELDKTILGKATVNLSWLSTHPTTENRILELEAKIKSMSFSNVRPVDFDLEDFKQHLRTHLSN